jgi:hypothetical protein
MEEVVVVVVVVVVMLCITAIEYPSIASIFRRRPQTS